MTKYTAFLSQNTLDDGVSLGCIINSVVGRELTEYEELLPVRFATLSKLQDALDRASNFGHAPLITDTEYAIDISKEQMVMLGFTRIPE